MTNRPEQKEWLSAAELAAMHLPGMPHNRCAIIRKAKKGQWQNRPHQGRGGGSEYWLYSMPKVTISFIIKQQKKQSEESKKITEKEIFELSPFQRSEAEKWIKLIQEWRSIEKATPKGKTVVLKAFCKHHGEPWRTFYYKLKAYQKRGYRGLILYQYTGVKKEKMIPEMKSFCRKKYLISYPPPTKVIIEEFIKEFSPKIDPAHMPTERTI